MNKKEEQEFVKKFKKEHPKVEELLKKKNEKEKEEKTRIQTEKMKELEEIKIREENDPVFRERFKVREAKIIKPILKIYYRTDGDTYQRVNKNGSLWEPDQYSEETTEFETPYDFYSYCRKAEFLKFFKPINNDNK